MNPDMPSEDHFPVILFQDLTIPGITYPCENKQKNNIKEIKISPHFK